MAKSNLVWPRQAERPQSKSLNMKSTVS